METITKKKVDQLSRKIIGAAIEVHRVQGPGLTEKIYEASMMRELELQGLKAVRQQDIIVDYKGVDLNCELRLDILVEDLIVCELKAVKEMHPIFEAILPSYMKLLKKPKGILINFHVRNIFHEGQKTFVNEYYAALPDE